MKGIRTQFGRVVLLGLLFGALVSTGWAETYALFDQRTKQQVIDYPEIIEALKPGDDLVFSNGTKFKVGNKLGSGSTTVVFELADRPGQAIRVPLKSGFYDTQAALRYTDFIDSSVKGYSTLQKNGIPSVAIHESYRGEFAVVEQVRADLTIKRLFHDPKLSDRLRMEMMTALKEFARKTAAFDRIGDFKPDQLYYDGPNKRWAILDWTQSHSEIPFDEERLVLSRGDVFLSRPDSLGQRVNFFRDYASYSVDAAGKVTWTELKPVNKWIAKLANQIHDAIQDERLKILKSGTRTRVAPRPTRSCMDSFMRSYLSF